MEPSLSVQRPTLVRLSAPAHVLRGLLAAGLALLTAGCGGTGPDRPDRDPALEAWSGDCRAPNGVIEALPAAVRADLDGDGAPDDVRRTPATLRTCPSSLVVDLGARRSALPVPSDARLRRVSVPGHRGDLVLARSTSSTSRSYVLVSLGGRGLGAVQTSGDDPVLPTTPTGTGRGLLSARCDGGGRLVVVRAVPHGPPGIVFAWDVTTTTYRLREVDAAPVGRAVALDNVLPGELARRAPSLVRPTVLAERCR